MSRKEVVVKNLLTAILALLLLFVPSLGGERDYGAVILYDRCSVKFFPDGRKVWREEKAVKITGKRGIKEFGEIVIPFSTEHQKLRLLYAYTVTPEGKRLKPSKRAINTVYPPFVSEAPIYSDLKYRTVSMPGVRVGSVIKYAYELETVKPYMENQFWETNYMQDEYPVEEATFKVLIPKGRYYRYRAYNMEGREAKPSIREVGGYVELTWKLKGVPPIEREPNMPPIEEVAKRVSVTSLRGWEEVAKWYSELAKEAIKPDSLVRETALRLVRGLKTNEEKLRAIYNFVAQNVRYVGMEFGINGYKPHRASEVLRNRYGDCKDHATLLVAMLRAVGIKGYPVLIPTLSRANLDPEMPMPTAFNHEIAAVKLKGKWLFMDTTSDFVPFGYLPPGDQGRRVLIVDVERGEGTIGETPLFPPDSNVEGFTGSFKLGRFGSLKGEFKFTYTGVYGVMERARLTGATKEQIKRHVEELASQVSPGFDVEVYRVSGLQNLNGDEVKVEVKGLDGSYGTVTSHYLLAKFPTPDYGRLVKLVAPKKRRYPYVIGYRMEKVSDVELELPAGYTLYLKPENYAFRNRVGSFSIRWEIEGRRLTLHSRMVLNRSTVPADEYRDLRELFNRAVKTLRNEVVVLRKGP